MQTFSILRGRFGMRMHSNQALGRDGRVMGAAVAAVNVKAELARRDVTGQA
jgi:hypothetical protein